MIWYVSESLEEEGKPGQERRGLVHPTDSLLDIGRRLWAQGSPLDAASIGKFAVCYFSLYTALGFVLHCNFLPWTWLVSYLMIYSQHCHCQWCSTSFAMYEFFANKNGSICFVNYTNCTHILHQQNIRGKILSHSQLRIHTVAVMSLVTCGLTWWAPSTRLLERVMGGAWIYECSHANIAWKWYIVMVKLVIFPLEAL